LRDGTPVATSPVAASTTVTLQDPGPVADGPHTYAATQTDPAGNTGVQKGGLSVTIDTSVATPGLPDLQAASDSGASNTDNKTTSLTQTFDIGGIEAGASVQVSRDGSVVMTVNGAASGTLSIMDPGSVPLGVHTYTAQQMDLDRPTIGR
jgi:hypothetical protein